jgi:hypothetical protein
MVKPATIDVLQTDHTTVVVVRLNEAASLSARQLVKLRLIVSAKAPCHSSDGHNEFGGSAPAGSMVRTLPIVVETPDDAAMMLLSMSLAQMPGWGTPAAMMSPTKLLKNNSTQKKPSWWMMGGVNDEDGVTS